MSSDEVELFPRVRDLFLHDGASLLRRVRKWGPTIRLARDLRKVAGPDAVKRLSAFARGRQGCRISVIDDLSPNARLDTRGNSWEIAVTRGMIELVKNASLIVSALARYSDLDDGEQLSSPMVEPSPQKAWTEIVA